MINLMIIYNVVNIFSMKNYQSSSKLRVGVNWYSGVNWSTTTIFFYSKSILKKCICLKKISFIKKGMVMNVGITIVTFTFPQEW